MLFAEFYVNLQLDKLVEAGKFIYATSPDFPPFESTDDNDVVYYDDTAITSFSLGTMNRYVHTKSSTGADSVYKTTYSGSNYAFYIDQLTCEIYNVDSLPKGTDAAHVITTISTKNGGTAIWKSSRRDKDKKGKTCPLTPVEFLPSFYQYDNGKKTRYVSAYLPYDIQRIIYYSLGILFIYSSVALE